MSREIVPSQKAEVAMIQIGENHIELLQPTAEESPIAKFLEHNGPGIDHLAVRVDDIEKTLLEYEQKGVRMIDTVPRDGKLPLFILNLPMEFCSNFVWKRKSEERRGNAFHSQLFFI